MGQSSSWKHDFEEEEEQKQANPTATKSDIPEMTIYCDIEIENVTRMVRLNVSKYAYMSQVIEQLSTKCKKNIELKDYHVQREYRTFEFKSINGENDRICCFGIEHNDTLSFEHKADVCKTINMMEDIKHGAVRSLTIKPFENNNGKPIIVNSYHISCQSDKIPYYIYQYIGKIINPIENGNGNGNGKQKDKKSNEKHNHTVIWGLNNPLLANSCNVNFEEFEESKNNNENINYVGIVLYSRNDETDWIVNGIHCKSGYIIFKKTNSFFNKNIKSRNESHHQQLYYHFFNEFAHNKDVKIIGAGFSIHNGEMKWNSTTFNEPHSNQDCKYHGKINEQINERSCHPLEIKWIMTALYNHKHNNIYTTQIDQSKDICWDCIIRG